MASATTTSVPGLTAQVHVGGAPELRGARIDDDELRAAALGLADDTE